jgi:hypothetical protein
MDYRKRVWWDKVSRNESPPDLNPPYEPQTSEAVCNGKGKNDKLSIYRKRVKRSEALNWILEMS